MRIHAALLSSILILGAAACGGPMPMIAAPSVPGAAGELAMKKDDNGNLRITITVHHLAPPDKVTIGTSVYVVWASPAVGGSPQNVGALKVDSNFDGSLETLTPQDAPTIFVTAEPSATVTSPSGQKLLWARGA